MVTIYCLTEWDGGMKKDNSELFMSLDGVVNWLINKQPIDNQIQVRDREIAGYYDINKDNIEKVLAASQKNGMAASFTIKRDFIIKTIETRFTLSKILVNG